MSEDFAFGCGKHSLTGTYEQQRMQFKKIAAIRDEMRARGAFEGVQIQEGQDPEHPLSPMTRVWLAEMDLVWDVWCAQQDALA